MKKFLILSLLTTFLVGGAVVVSAATNNSPKEMFGGNSATIVEPVVKSKGDDAQVVVPNIVEDKQETFEPFIPGIYDDDEFVDMDQTIDYSKTYNYNEAYLSSYYGRCDLIDGTYTALTSASIYANMEDASAFPYGTISADIMNNGGDTGIIFGLSTHLTSFWEGNSISYYFAFVSFEGVLFLGRTVNGVWSTLTYTSISSFNSSNTYNLKVLYRVDKIILFLDDVPLLSYRTPETLSGTGWGIRTGAVGATISNLAISNKVTLD